MHSSTAAVVALLPTFGVATRFLNGAGHSQAISMQQLKQSGGSLGTPNLATSLMKDMGLPSSVQDFAEGDSPQKNGNAGNAPGVNDCGFSTFVQLKEDYGYSQASVQDCYNLMWTIQNDQEWIITQEIQTLAENGTCKYLHTPDVSPHGKSLTECRRFQSRRLSRSGRWSYRHCGQR